MDFSQSNMQPRFGTILARLVQVAPALALLAQVGLPRVPNPVAHLPQTALEARPASPAVQDSEAELAEQPRSDVEAELDQIDMALRRGKQRQARRDLQEILEHTPDSVRAHCILAGVLAGEGDYVGGRKAAATALELALGQAQQGPPPSESVAAAARELAHIQWRLGLVADAASTLERAQTWLDPKPDARSAWIQGRVHWTLGDRDKARSIWRAAMDQDPGATWERLLARARCERALGLLEKCSASLVACDALPGADPRGEPDVLVELGEVYFEADGEVDESKARSRSAAKQMRAALELHPAHQGALLGMFRLHRINWNRSSKPADEWLTQLLHSAPRSIEGLLAAAATDLDDGNLVRVRERLGSLEELAPMRREVRTLRAALSWVEHGRERATELLSALESEDALDSRPRREVGRHLCELYRFAEARPFLERAVEIDATDYLAWTELGRARANSGDEQGALAALHKAEEKSSGRQNAWRHNTRLVLERMQRTFTRETCAGELAFRWHPEPAALLRLYQLPFYQSAREELAARYGFTPGPVEVQVFEKFQDFSVRSTGFEGFPALGVCFGPVVTSVSPAAEVRGQFNWARTAFHEFTHVVHLGLSHNRCPRWITEGLATWEETQKHHSWTRNMRRDLLDAFHNDDLIGVRDLNRAFRGPRILFGYYQGGLLCEMLIEQHGFPAMVRLLEAFDLGLDVDQAFQSVFNQSPEAVDARFRERVAAMVSGLALEPRWSAGQLARARMEFSRPMPGAGPAREAWIQAGLKVALGEWQSGASIDAQEALRKLQGAGPESARAAFLRGQMDLRAGQGVRAREHFERGLALGGRDFSASLALAASYRAEGQNEQALRHLEQAEAAFPGYPEPKLAAELALAEMLLAAGKEDLAWQARERWLAYDSDAYEFRLQLAARAAARSDHAQAARWYDEANQIDPFLRTLHEKWGESLLQLGRFEEALRESKAAALVPPQLDDETLGPLTDVERARYLALAARALVGLERLPEARAAIEQGLVLDPGSSALLELKPQFAP